MVHRDIDAPATGPTHLHRGVHNLSRGRVGERFHAAANEGPASLRLRNAQAELQKQVDEARATHEQGLRVAAWLLGVVTGASLTLVVVRLAW